MADMAGHCHERYVLKGVAAESEPIMEFHFYFLQAATGNNLHLLCGKPFEGGDAVTRNRKVVTCDTCASMLVLDASVDPVS